MFTNQWGWKSQTPTSEQRFFFFSSSLQPMPQLKIAILRLQNSLDNTCFCCSQKISLLATSFVHFRICDSWFRIFSTCNTIDEKKKNPTTARKLQAREQKATILKKHSGILISNWQHNKLFSYCRFASKICQAPRK